MGSLFFIGDATTGTGISGLADALKGILTTDAFLGALTTLVPVIGGVLIFAFVYRTVRKLVNGSQKGKAKI